MTNDSKRKEDMPIEDEMQESRDKSIGIMMFMQVAFFMEGLIGGIALTSITLVSLFVYHFTKSQIINELIIGVGIIIGIMILTFWAGYRWQTKMLKEYD